MSSHKRLFFAATVAAIGIGLLTACNSTSANSPGGSGGPNVSSPLTLEQADQVAETFLKAWEETDYATMYSLISPNSRDAYNDAKFAEEYDLAATQITLNTLETSITSSLRQGTTAVIQYDVLFHSELFGDITDSARTMRLIETPEGWRVAWSRMDIFADLAEGARLDRVQTLPNRGNIYDRNGKVLVDQEGRSIVVYLVKQDIPNETACIQLLSRIMRREYSDLQALFDQYYPETRFFVGELDPETYQAEEANLLQACDVGDDQFDTYTRRTRRYWGELAPHIIGYVSQIQPEQLAEYQRKGYPQDALIGQAGVEQAYEEYLAGKPGAELKIVAPTGETVRKIAQANPEPGQSVYLTIDRDLQEAVQNAFYEAYSFAGPTWARTSHGAAAVVMDVKTGEILAMVSYPWFDPGLFNPDSPVPNRAEAIGALESDPSTPMVNRATAGSYPAGSIFKIVSTAAGLDSGIYTRDTWYTCVGSWSNPEDALPRRTDWIYPGAHGTINFQQALTYSCDAYYWELGVNLHKADPNLLPNYAYKMGLGVSTGQDVLPEEVGYIPNPADHFRRNAVSWALGDTANLVIGQGQMQITPLQITRMVAAVANGGKLWQPLFVSRAELIGEPPSYTAQPTALSALDFAPSTFETIREGLCQVTLDPNGTARYMFEDWYAFQRTDVVVCGKTGTAQTGGETTRPQAWFAAFAPQDDPEIAVTVIVENSCEGSEVSAPIVRRIVEDYYGMPHGEWPPLWQTGCFDLGE
jgi:penicillin-binding protein 2